MDKLKAIAPIITALTSLCIAIVVWVQALSVQTMTNEHGVLLEELKSDLETSRDRLKNELAKELASEESLLRIRSELRIRMFEMGAKSVDEAGVTLQSHIYTYANYWQGRGRDEVVPRTRLAEVTNAVIGTGMFMPPELTDIFENARSYILGDMKQQLHKALSLSVNDKGLAQKIAQETLAEANRKAAAFRTAALQWKKAEWDNFTKSD